MSDDASKPKPIGAQRRASSSNTRLFRPVHFVLLLLVVGLGLFLWYRSEDALLSRESTSVVTSAAAKPLLSLESVTRAGRLEKLQMKEIIEREDPSTDGWDSELFSNKASSQLKKLGKLLANPSSINAEHQAEFAEKDCVVGPLRPGNLAPVLSNDCLRVLRSDSSSQTANRTPLSDALHAIAEPFDGATDVRTKFKVIRVDVQPSGVNTTVLYEAVGRFDQGAVQQRATWRCQWSRHDNDELLLESVDTVNFEEVVNEQNRDKWFADCTESVLRGNRSYHEQLVYGIDHWRERIDSSAGLNLASFHGLAVGDCNGDGLDDVYVCQAGGIPNRLYLQQSDGTVRDVSEAANIDFLDSSASALFLDLDNDGDQDLVVALEWGVVMLSNDGDAVFTIRDRMPLGVQPYSLSAVDYDNDRDLDFYIGSQTGVLSGGVGLPASFYDARNGARNFLVANQGNWKFSNVAEEVGLNVHNDRFTLASSWEDFDNDGDMDLYVANDFGRNNLYRNDDGLFVDAAAEVGVEDIAAGMSTSWGDFNNDGLMDLYVSNMFSSAGNRITFQTRFQTSADERTKQHFKRFARGNTLFQNAGDGTFRDVSLPSGVAMGRWAWGSVFADLNNDGWLDIYVLNGYVTQSDPNDL